MKLSGDIILIIATKTTTNAGIPFSPSFPPVLTHSDFGLSGYIPLAALCFFLMDQIDRGERRTAHLIHHSDESLQAERRFPLRGPSAFQLDPRSWPSINDCAIETENNKRISPMANQILKLNVKTGEKDGKNFWNTCGVAFVTTDDHGNITSINFKHDMFPGVEMIAFPKREKDDA